MFGQVNRKSTHVLKCVSSLRGNKNCTKQYSCLQKPSAPNSQASQIICSAFTNVHQVILYSFSINYDNFIIRHLNYLVNVEKHLKHILLFHHYWIQHSIASLNSSTPPEAKAQVPPLNIILSCIIIKYHIIILSYYHVVMKISIIC